MRLGVTLRGWQRLAVLAGLVSHTACGEPRRPATAPTPAAAAPPAAPLSASAAPPSVEDAPPPPQTPSAPALPPPPGELQCRAHDGPASYELYVSFTDGGLGTGTLRKETDGGVEDEPLSVQSWKGSLLLDTPGSANVTQTRGRLLQLERKLQVGADWNAAWLECDPPPPDD